MRNLLLHATAAALLLCALPAAGGGWNAHKEAAVAAHRALANGPVLACANYYDILTIARMANYNPTAARQFGLEHCDTFDRTEPYVVDRSVPNERNDIGFLSLVCLRHENDDPPCLWTLAIPGDANVVVRQHRQEPPAPAPVPVPAPTQHEQATAPTAPPTLPQGNLSPLSVRLAEINQLARQSLPIVIRHCGSDATCRKDQTAAIHELANKETVIAKALRNPTTYTSAVLENDTVNACIVMWSASEDFAATMRCINDAAPTM